jgi:hypothetical protein
MKVRQSVAICLVLGMIVGAIGHTAWGARQKAPDAANETYTPTVHEWLQVWSNANFGRNDSRRTLQFLVDPRKKEISMAFLITASPTQLQLDPGLQGKLSIEANMVAQQVEGYAKRFGYKFARQEIPAQ